MGSPSIPTCLWLPRYMEQKATIDAIFVLAFALFTYVNPVPTVTSVPRLVQSFVGEGLSKNLVQECLSPDPRGLSKL